MTCCILSHQKRGRMKGTIALSTVKAVEPVDDGAFGRGFCFQVLCLVEVTVQASIITSEGNKINILTNLYR